MHRMKSNFPCICGHTKFFHEHNGRGEAWVGVCCEPIVSKHDGKLPFCHHNEFKLDNLKYLEIMHKESICE